MAATGVAIGAAVASAATFGRSTSVQHVVSSRPERRARDHLMAVRLLASPVAP